MTEFAADWACADLNPLEHGALVGLASLGYKVTVTDLAAFCGGYCGREVTEDETRVALVVLDALGWAAPSPDYAPQTAAEWRLTVQGRIALERRP